MTEKIFSMPVRVNDFMASTVNLTNEKLGMYFRLICFAWEDKAQLTQNLDEIYEICKAYDEETKKKVDSLIIKYFEFNQISKCFEQNGQKKEWHRVNKNHVVKSENGKLGGRPKANGKLNESKDKALIPIPIPKLNNKIKYTPEFDKFWENDGRSIKSDTYKEFNKLTVEDKKEIKDKWQKYKSEKGEFFVACERFLRKRIFDQVISVKQAASDNEIVIKTKVQMWEKGMMKYLAKPDEIQKALKMKLITPEFAKELG
jgi:uncharacterized protein YdaU (DUF1376 family)